MTVWYKEHAHENGRVLAACDHELIGKTLVAGELEFFVSESFYKGRKADEKELVEKLKKSDNSNLIGNRVVGIALSQALVDADSVIEIQGVKHAQIFTI